MNTTSLRKLVKFDIIDALTEKLWDTIEAYTSDDAAYRVLHHDATKPDLPHPTCILVQRAAQ